MVESVTLNELFRLHATNLEQCALNEDCEGVCIFRLESTSLSCLSWAPDGAKQKHSNHGDNPSYSFIFVH